MTLSLTKLICYHAVSRYAEVRVRFIVLLNVFMLSVVMLSVFMLRVFMLRVIMLFVVMLNVVAPSPVSLCAPVR